MSSKPKFFSWSKGRQLQAAEPYHRTGGLLSIDTSVGDWSKEAYLASNTLVRDTRLSLPRQMMRCPEESREARRVDVVVQSATSRCRGLHASSLWTILIR